MLAPPGDPKALAAALQGVLDDEVHADELRTAGRQRAEHFSMDRLADIYLSLYRRLAPVDSRS